MMYQIVYLILKYIIIFKNEGNNFKLSDPYTVVNFITNQYKNNHFDDLKKETVYKCDEISDYFGKKLNKIDKIEEILNSSFDDYEDLSLITPKLLEISYDRKAKMLKFQKFRALKIHFIFHYKNEKEFYL